MHDTCPMRLCEGIGDLPAESQNIGRLQRSFCDLPGQRSAVQELHHQIVGADVEQCADVRMAERSQSSSLPIETFAEARCANLDGYPAVQSGIDGAEHLAHAPCAQPCFRPVDSELHSLPKRRPGST